MLHFGKVPAELERKIRAFDPVPGAWTLLNGEALKIPAMMPFLSATPGRTDWPGATVGQHNDEVLGELLGYSSDERQTLSRDGVI